MSWMLWLACGGGEVIYLTDANNHGLTRTLDIPVETVAAHADLSFDVSAVETDLRCQPLTTQHPWLMFLQMSDAPDALLETLERGDLRQTDVLGVLEQPVDCGAGRLSEMTFLGQPADTSQEPAPGETYLLVMTAGTAEDAWGTPLSMAILQGDSGETRSSVALSDGCGQVVASARIPHGGLDLKRASAIDWSQLEHTALGEPLDSAAVTELEIGYFSGMSAADLEADYLALDALVTQRWTLDVTDRTSVWMDELWALDRFDPADGDGVWVLALRCPGCLDSLPVYMSIIR